MRATLPEGEILEAKTALLAIGRRPSIDVPWVDWITSDEVKKISDAMEVLTTLTAQKVPLFRRRVRRLIDNGRYDSPLIRTLDGFRTRYAFGSEERWQTRALRFVVNSLLRRDHPLKFRAYALSKQRDEC